MKWLSCLFLLIAGATIPGCGYGEVGPIAYEDAKALYTITNQKAVARLEGMSERVETQVASGEISGREAAWLQTIIAHARNEQWVTAQQSCRKLMEDQVLR